MVFFVCPPHEGAVVCENIVFLDIECNSAPCLLIQGMQYLILSRAYFDGVRCFESSLCVINSISESSFTEVLFSRCELQDQRTLSDCTFYNPDQTLGTTERSDQTNCLQLVYERIRLQRIGSYTDQDDQLVITLELSDMPQNPSSLMLAASGDQNEEQIALLFVFVWMDDKYQLSSTFDSSSSTECLTVYVVSSGIKVGKDNIWLFSVSFRSESFIGSAVNFTAESGGQKCTQE
ncbi:hypothetical protein BLNAU_3293 [Blattamonas nauphoetae]|uniref:Uncharacterized protein n=1 Tax=Blattamonas nauphoetae TaxID=2049346 RepID=A0ABQ9YDL6_9EUKA|nr:hypothetical protein BLNAU_3293 [Blattamonas nauphoetae]